MAETFPFILWRIQDSAYFSEEYVDNSVSGALEGGYKHTRPRTTRAMRRRFKTGFTDISATENATLQAFVRLVGTNTPFTWVNPVYQTTHTVRFETIPRAKYVGMGGNHMFTVDTVTLLEV